MAKGWNHGPFGMKKDGGDRDGGWPVRPAGQFASLDGVLRFRDDRTGSLVELALDP